MPQWRIVCTRRTWACAKSSLASAVDNRHSRHNTETSGLKRGKIAMVEVRMKKKKKKNENDFLVYLQSGRRQPMLIRTVIELTKSIGSGP